MLLHNIVSFPVNILEFGVILSLEKVFKVKLKPKSSRIFSHIKETYMTYSAINLPIDFHRDPDTSFNYLRYKDISVAILIVLPMCIAYTRAVIALTRLAKYEANLYVAGFSLAFSINFDDQVNKMFNRWFSECDIKAIKFHYERFDNIKPVVKLWRAAISFVIIVVTVYYIFHSLDDPVCPPARE